MHVYFGAASAQADTIRTRFVSKNSCWRTTRTAGSRYKDTQTDHARAVCGMQVRLMTMASDTMGTAVDEQNALYKRQEMEEDEGELDNPYMAHR